MDVLLALVVAIGLLAGLAVPVLVVRALWRGLGDELRRRPREHRRRGILGGGLAAAGVVAMTALAIAAPWGPDTVLYEAGVLGAVMLPMLLVAVAVQAVRDTRRAKARRARPPSTG